MVQRQAETTGPTVKEAVNLALLQLGLEADDVDVEVIAEPRKGLFGNTKPAQVRVTAKSSAAASPDAPAAAEAAGEPPAAPAPPPAPAPAEAPRAPDPAPAA